MQKTDNLRVATLPIGICRATLAALFGVALFVSSSGAQDRVTLKDAPRGMSPVGGVFGDTVQNAVRILAIDPAIESASAYLRSPKNILVLGVVPGKEIELISPGDMVLGAMGDNTFALVMNRFEITTAATQKRNEVDQQRYAACNRERAIKLRQNAENARRRNAPRDSLAAKAPPVPDYAATDIPFCDMPTGETNGGSLARRQLPLRPDAERYLVVVTSSKPFKAAEVEKRLRGLTVVASNPKDTIESIAAGLLAGNGAYGGAWVPW